MSRRILITGGGGFIGSHLAAAHARDGDEVHILVRPGSTKRMRAVPFRNVEVHRVRLDDQQRMVECLDRVHPEVIYHLASSTGRDTSIPPPGAVPLLLRDLTNLLTLLAAASECRRPPKLLIRAGSLAEYGDGAHPATEDQREAPLTVYSTAMVAGAHYSRMLQPRLPFPVVTARFALTYGPGQEEDFLLPWLINRCLRGEASEIRDPDARRDMVFVDDLVSGLRKMAESDLAAGTIVNLASGVDTPVRELALMVADACNADPGLLHFSPSAPKDHRVRSLQGSPDRASRLLGWEAKTSLPEGIRRCIATQQRKEESA